MTPYYEDLRRLKGDPVNKHQPELYWSYPQDDETAHKAATVDPVAAVLLAVGCAIVERLETIAVRMGETT